LRPDQADELVSVGLVDFKPIFVTGAVKTPGRHPYEIGMTVLHAVAVAGGLLSQDMLAVDDRVRLLRAEEAFRSASAALGSALARRSGLMAELDGKNEIALPEEVGQFVTEGVVRELMEREARILNTARAGQEAAQQSAERSLSIVKTQIRAYRGQLEAKEEEGRLLAQDIKAFESARSGVSAVDVRQLRRIAAGIRGDALELQALIARGQARMEEITHDVERARQDRLLQVSETLAAAEERIQRLRIEVDQSRAMVATQRALSAEGASRIPTTHPTVEVRLVRKRNNVHESIEADMLTPIAPGDLVQIRPSSATDSRLPSS
jgi:uncharacterized protein (UPF0335 family)